MMDNKYSAVIVTMNPEIDRIRNNVKSLVEQGFSVIIVDNHSDNVDSLRNLDIDLIELDDNKGVAFALNEGMRASEKHGAEWVLSLDQDTTFSKAILIEYLKYLNQLENLGALSPRIIKKGEKDSTVSEEKVQIIEKCPTSGFFLNVTAWNRVGKYNEWMFIDYVDYDMCMRLRLAGYCLYRINTTWIVQELGNMKNHPWIKKVGDVLNNKKVKNFAITYNHSPFRNYYYVRNCLYYIKTYGDYLNVRYERRHLIKWETKKLLLESNRINIMKSIIRGIKDYRKQIKDISQN